MTQNIPKLMTIPEIAKTGLLPETALRRMVKSGEIPAVYSGAKAFINFDNLCKKLALLGAVEESSHKETLEQIRINQKVSAWRTAGLNIERRRSYE